MNRGNSPVNEGKAGMNGKTSIQPPLWPQYIMIRPAGNLIFQSTAAVCP